MSADKEETTRQEFEPTIEDDDEDLPEDLPDEQDDGQDDDEGLDDDAPDQTEDDAGLAPPPCPGAPRPHADPAQRQTAPQSAVREEAGQAETDGCLDAPDDGSTAGLIRHSRADLIDRLQGGFTTVRGTDDNLKTEAVLSQWEAQLNADAQTHGGVVPLRVRGLKGDAAARLKQAGPLPSVSDTETELNGLIAECRFLMHEVAFHSARLTYNSDDRIRFLDTAERMALSAAKVGEAVARLRSAGAPAPVDCHRHELVYRRLPSPRGSKGKSEKQ